MSGKVLKVRVCYGDHRLVIPVGKDTDKVAFFIIIITQNYFYPLFPTVPILFVASLY